MTHEEVAIVSTFCSKMLVIRDLLDPIVKGEIKRGRCLAGQSVACGGMRGKRKTTFQDAARIASHIQAAINLAIDDLDKHLD
jgi:hypothetical protein